MQSAAQVINFLDAKAQKEAAEQEAIAQAQVENAAADMVSAALLGIPGEKPYVLETLKMLVDCSVRVVYFSGDIEPGQAREKRVCNPEQLLKASTTQVFDIQDMGGIIRLSFDGEYFYDLYLTQSLIEPTSFRDQLLKCFETEAKCNRKIAEYNSALFQAVIAGYVPE